MRHARARAAYSVLMLVLLALNGRAASSRAVDDEAAVREMRDDLRAFADGSWVRRLLEGRSDESAPRRVARVRAEICRGLERHDETFRRLPVARQQAFLVELLETLEHFEPISATAADSRRVVAPLESWRAGYRGHLMARYTRAWETRSETLLRFLKTLRLLPDGKNLFDGTLVGGCLRYVNERYGSTGSQAIADAQLILLHEFERFEQSVAALELDQQLDVWMRWRLGLRDGWSPNVTAPADAEVSLEATDALSGWTRERARAFESALGARLHDQRERLLERLVRRAPSSPRLESMIERLASTAIDEEAKRWWLHESGDRIVPGEAASKSLDELLEAVNPDEDRARLRARFEVIRSAVRDRRWREASVRAAALSKEEQSYLKRRLWIEELGKEEVK